MARKFRTAKGRWQHNASTYRSGLEEVNAKHLAEYGCPAEYEKHKIQWVMPAEKKKYTADFVLPNGIIVETKGQFDTADRKKHKLIKAQFPLVDIRFVFTRSKQTISKQSKTTYAKWCEDHGFLYADKLIPPEWMKEPLCAQRLTAAHEAFGYL